MELIEFISVRKMSKMSEKTSFCQKAAGVNGLTLSLTFQRATEVECVNRTKEYKIPFSRYSGYLRVQLSKRKYTRIIEGCEQSMFSKAKIFASPQFSYKRLRRCFTNAS